MPYIYIKREVRQRSWEGFGLISICVYEKVMIMPEEKGSSDFGNPITRVCVVRFATSDYSS